MKCFFGHIVLTGGLETIVVQEKIEKRRDQPLAGGWSNLTADKTNSTFATCFRAAQDRTVRSGEGWKGGNLEECCDESIN